MYKHCNTEDSARRQRQLEQCLLELMAEVPYSAITIGQICERCGISRKSFYRYFDSKDGCLHALLDHTFIEGATYYTPEADTEQFDIVLCNRIFEYWQKQTPLLDALEKNCQSLQIPQRLIRYILTEEPEYARYMGIAPSDMMEHVVFTVSGVMGLVLAWHHEGYQKTAAQMGELLYHMIQRESSEGGSSI